MSSAPSWLRIGEPNLECSFRARKRIAETRTTFGAIDPGENPLYAKARDLPSVHWESLGRRNPEAAASAAGAAWDGRVFRLPFLGRSLSVCLADRTVCFQRKPGTDVGYQRALVAVTYLASALDIPPRGSWVSFRELPSGDSFFRGPHSLPTSRLEREFGRTPERLVTAAEALGGTSADGADAAAQLPALPRIPLRVLLWARTSEFPSAANLLIDARAHLHLPLDVLWALANLTISDLVEAVR